MLGEEEEGNNMFPSAAICKGFFSGRSPQHPSFPPVQHTLQPWRIPRRPRIHGFPDIENSVFIRLSFTGHVS